MSEQISTPTRAPREPASGWAAGLAVFAGVLMGIVGLFQVLQGLAAIFRGNFFVTTPNYVYNVDVTAWGWTHLLIGILVALAGFAIFTGRVWARAVGITLAALNAISQFLFLPHYPLWSMLMIALDIAIIWALAVYGRSAAR